jgi:hypothetical protein
MTNKTCRAITPPGTDACGKPATHKVTFKDGDLVTTCHTCALALEQLAATHGHEARVKVEKLSK